MADTKKRFDRDRMLDDDQRFFNTGKGVKKGHINREIREELDIDEDFEYAIDIERFMKKWK
jgi:hypothetical protein